MGRLDELAALGIRSGFGNDMLRLGYLKGFMDGTLGSATALLLDGSGVEITSRAKLEDVVRRAARGLASGGARDRRRGQPSRARCLRDDPRRVEPARVAASHRACAAARSEEFARFAEIGVTASVQFSHAPSTATWRSRLWEGRDGAYAYRSLADAGTLLANGSDAPSSSCSPASPPGCGARSTGDRRGGPSSR